jgi:hypothetical protein
MVYSGWLILGLTLILILPIIFTSQRGFHPFLIRAKSNNPRKDPRKRSE